MGTTEVPISKCGGLYKDIDAALITWSGAEPNAQANCFYWVWKANDTTI